MGRLDDMTPEEKDRLLTEAVRLLHMIARMDRQSGHPIDVKNADFVTSWMGNNLLYPLLDEKRTTD